MPCSARAWGPLAVLWCAALLSGCGVWRSNPAALDAPLPQRQPVQIWSGGRALTVHGVMVSGDSVRAVPRWKPPTCDTCAILYSRRAIDSVQVKVFSPVRTGLLMSFLLALQVLVIHLSHGPWMS